jgi:hypothetical protein
LDAENLKQGVSGQTLVIDPFLYHLAESACNDL